MLGKLEEWVLLASLQAGEDALPSEIYSRMEEAKGGGKPPAFGAVYTTLGRMASKGLLSEASKTDSAGKKRRIFSVTGAGRRALIDSMDRIHSLGGFGLVGGAYA